MTPKFTAISQRDNRREQPLRSRLRTAALPPSIYRHGGRWGHSSGADRICGICGPPPRV